MADKIEFARLHAILTQTKLQVTNNPAYQTIFQLINAVEELADELQTQVTKLANLKIPPPNGGGGTIDPSDTVANLDGTMAAGVLITYSRGDHKHADFNRPSDNEKAALAGTDGTPSGANKFVTQSDPAHIGTPGPPGSTGPQGPKGDTGNTGPQGNPGPGVAIGGTAGQVLSKVDATNYNTTWVTPSATLVPHHTTHELGGSDVVTLAQSQITGLSTSLAGKVDTTDPRLTNARTPTAHATTHESGGSDPVMNLPAGVTITGANENLEFYDPTAGFDQKRWRIICPPNSQTWAFEAINDAYTATMATPLRLFKSGGSQLQGPVEIDNKTIIQYDGPRFQMKDLGQVPGSQNFELASYRGIFYIQGVDDPGTGGFTPSTKFDRVGNVFVSNAIYERGRTDPVGQWIPTPYNAGDFVADGTTWSVDGTFQSYCYMMIGDTLWLSLQVLSSHSVLAAPAQFLRIAIPGGRTVKRGTIGSAVVSGAGYGWESCMIYMTTGSSQVFILRTNGSGASVGGVGTFPAGGIHVWFTIPININ